MDTEQESSIELESPTVDDLAHGIAKKKKNLGELVCYWCKKPIVMGQSAMFIKLVKKTKTYHKEKCYDLADAATSNSARETMLGQS